VQYGTRMVIKRVVAINIERMPVTITRHHTFRLGFPSLLLRTSIQQFILQFGEVYDRTND
ncbi:MAG: hypothetical protein K2X09_07380, partial [Rickettsiales bacterium]|nr:hypothetical protein [Rickettsiales bacterium]